MSVLAAPAFGDVGALRDDAVTLRGRARAAERLAHVVRRTDVGWWSGEAADAFGEALSATARRLLCAADDALAAAQALERHADVVAWARDEASGPIVSSLEHEARLLELRHAVRVSAEKAAAVLRAIAEGIERLPDGWDVAAYLRDQYWSGMGDSLAGMVEGSWQVQTFRFVTDPFGFAGEQQLIGQALHAGARDDPVGLARDMVGWDTWRTEPVRAAGQQVPDLLLSAATAGTGSAAAAGGRLSRLTSIMGRTMDGDAPPVARPKGDLGGEARSSPFDEHAGDVARTSLADFLANPHSLRGATWEQVVALVPDTWAEGPLRKGEGIRFFNLDRRGEAIMIEKGSATAWDPVHHGPYVRVSTGGVVYRVPLAGNPDLAE